MKDDLDAAGSAPPDSAVPEGEPSYRDIFNATSDGLFVHDENGRILLANDRICELLGYSHQELLGLSIRDLSLDQPPYTQAEALERIGHALEHGSCVFPWWSKRKNGEVFWSEVALRACTIAGKRRIIASARDITERKQAELALRESEEKFAKVFRGAPALIAITDLDSGIYIDVNEWALQISGYTREEVVGHTAIELGWLTVEQRQRLREKVEAEGCIAGHELTFRTKSGSRLEGLVQGEQIMIGGRACLLTVTIDITGRKRAEAEVKRLSEWLLRTQRISKVGGWGINLKTREVWVSPEARRIYGANEDQPLTIAQVQSFPLSQYRSMLNVALDELVDRGTPYDVEFQITRADDGAIVDIHSMAEYHAEEVAVLGVIEDVTERKQAERVLRESEARIAQLLKEKQTILEAAPIGIALTRNRVIQWANAAHGALHGYSLEELRNLDTSVLYFRSEDYERVGREASNQFTQGLTYAEEVEFRRKNGSSFWCLMRGRAIDPGNLSAGAIWMIMDVTERRKAQDDLASSEAELAAIHDSSPLMMCLVNEQRHVERLNRAMAEFAANEGLPEFGLRPGDVLGCVNALDDPRGCGFGKSCQSCALRLAIRTTFETGQACRQLESQMFLVRGNLRREIQVWAATSLLRLRGTPRVLLCLEDITQRKQLEAQFMQAQKMESVGQLAGGVAHDFNNILAAMMLQLSLLQQNPNFDPDTQESLMELTLGAQRAANLTRQLLLFSRRSVMETKVLDLNELMANLLKMLGRLIGEHISLRFDRFEPLPPVEADPGMVEQILMNLALNARDAMPKGGRLTISLNPIPVDAERVKGKLEVRPGLFVCLAVADTGSGMDHATLKRIFEPFFTTKEPGKGTGLGLATVYGIAAQHKGWVEVVSELGKGSTFKVFFPASAGLRPEARQLAEGVIVRGQETILLVEDEAGVRRGLLQVLQQLGYRVLEAANGQEALNLWQEHVGQVDLLFSDMVMPRGLTGLDLAQKLREQQPALKVIISSGYYMEMAGQDRSATEGIVYLQKPYELAAMSSAIRECLDEK